MTSAPDHDSRNHEPDEDIRKQNRELGGSLNPGLIDDRLIGTLSKLAEQLDSIRNWLTNKPGDQTFEKIAVNLDTAFWLIEDDYIARAPDGEDATLLLGALRIQLRAAAFALGELKNVERKSRIDGLGEAHDRLLALQKTLKIILDRYR